MTITRRIFRYLNENCKYAVLRNYKGLPEDNYSRDIDLIISKKCFEKAKNGLINTIIDNNYKIITTYRSFKMESYTIVNITDMECDILQIDFCFFIGAHSINMIDANTILASRVFNGKIYHVNEFYEFLDKYLYNRLVGAQYPSKYEAKRKNVEQNHDKELRVLLTDILGRKYNTLEIIDNTSSKKLRRIANKKNLMTIGIIQVYNMLMSFYYSLYSFLIPRGFSIGFTGPDGAGKTTVLNIVHNSLKNVFANTYVHHFRPDVFPRIAELLRKLGIKEEVDKNYDKPHRGKETGIVSSSIRLCYYCLDYITGYWLNIHSVLHKRGIVIFDRYYEDIITDSKRSRINLNYKLITFIGKLVPKMRYHVLLTAETNLILSRKQELNKEQIDDINKKLVYLMNNSERYYLIENNGTPNETAMDILNYIFEAQDKMNRRYLKFNKGE